MFNIDSILQMMVRTYRGMPFEVRDWDGQAYRVGHGSPGFLIHFHSHESFSRSLLETSLGFGESYAAGDITIEGNLEDVVIALTETYLRLDPQGWTPGWLQRLLGRSLGRQKADIEHHYGLGNDFYRFFLDKRLQYSCAYFRTPEDTLDLAQEQKIAYTAAKLDLRPGLRLLDIGCGWGHLMFHAAETYGVTCLGLTLCENQAEYIRERAKARRIPVEVRVLNYLELDTRKPWDRVVSVGMLEHVGRDYTDRYFDTFQNALMPGGIGLLHAIATMQEGLGTDPFLQKHIFPGYWLPSVEGMTERAVKRGLNIIDVENLRRHYTKTARCWRHNFRSNLDAIKQATGFTDRFLRGWDFYLCCVIAGFQAAQINLVQMVLVKGANDDYPDTREFLFGGRTAPLAQSFGAG
jgi:cyclopropane-fatty-acyl-phospholipid synthase